MKHEENRIELTCETVDKPTHLWRCMNCNKMTYEYICTYCGKPSYNKTATEKEIPYKSDKTTVNCVVPKSPKESTKNNYADNIYKKELDSIADKLNKNITNSKKTAKNILSVASGLFVALCTVFIVNFYNLESKISNLSEKNQELLNLINNQVKQTEEIKKIAELNANSQIKYIVHTVESGETLLSICEKYNIEYSSNKNIITAINGIENTSIILPGQKIILLKFDNQ